MDRHPLYPHTETEIKFMRKSIVVIVCGVLLYFGQTWCIGIMIVFAIVALASAIKQVQIDIIERRTDMWYGDE